MTKRISKGIKINKRNLFTVTKRTFNSAYFFSANKELVIFTIYGGSPSLIKTAIKAANEIMYEYKPKRI